MKSESALGLLNAYKNVGKYAEIIDLQPSLYDGSGTKGVLVEELEETLTKGFNVVDFKMFYIVY